MITMLFLALVVSMLILSILSFKLGRLYEADCINDTIRIVVNDEEGRGKGEFSKGAEWALRRIIELK